MSIFYLILCLFGADTVIVGMASKLSAMIATANVDKQDNTSACKLKHLVLYLAVKPKSNRRRRRFIVFWMAY